MDNNHQFQPDPKFFARTQLLDDMLNYRKTDHVPAAPMIQYLPIYLYGDTTVQDVMMDYGKAENCFIRFHQEYQPDFAWGPSLSSPAPHWKRWTASIFAGRVSICRIPTPPSRFSTAKTATWALKSIWNMQRIPPAS